MSDVGSALTLIALGILGAVALVLVAHTPYTPFPIFGQLHAFAGKDRQQHLDWFLRGSLYFNSQTWKLRIPFVGSGWVINDPAALRHVLTTKHSSFGKGVFFESRARDLFGNGILIATGDSWRAQRTAGHSFTTPPTLKHFSTVTLARNLPVLLEPIEKLLKKSDSTSSVVVDMQDLAMDYSMAVFGEIAFDADWHRLSTQFSEPFHAASTGISSRFKTPFYELFELLLPHGRKLRKDLNQVHRISRELVKESLEAIEHEIEGESEVATGKGLLVKKLLGGGITDEEQLADSCLNFLTAGRDTTGQAITWTLYALLRHPHYIPPIQEEIDRLFSQSPAGRSTSPLSMPSANLEKDLPLLEAAISEALRLHPPIPIEILENISTESVILPDQARTIVAPGEQVLWSPWVMARLPFWGPAADTFKPERWLNSSDANNDDIGKPNKMRPTAYENPVFHAGPRSCVGQPLARLELVFALSELLGRYDFCLLDGQRRGVGNGLTSPMVSGLEVRVSKREGQRVHSP